MLGGIDDRAEDLDDETGPYYRDGYRLALARLAGDPMRLGGPDSAARLEPLTINLGDGTQVRISWQKANTTDAIKALRRLP